MKKTDSQIAVTLFNLRDYCKTESDLDATLDKVCEIGYKVVQVSAVNLPADVIRKQLDKHELYCCATHEGLPAISGDLAPLIDKLQTLDCTFAALGSAPAEYRTQEKMLELAHLFNVQAEKLLEHGIRLGYHNHDYEFEKKGAKTTMFETFYTATDARKVCAEIDVHWVTRGGASPVYWINRLAGRIPVIHFKDFVKYEGEPRFCEIGEGNLDWKGIIEACRNAGVEFFSVEQDTEFPGRNIFDSIKISYDNMRAMGLK